MGGGNGDVVSGVGWRVGVEGDAVVMGVCFDWVWQEGLRARSELYCVCRKPYDQDEAMIACDHCSEWYHYSCLGLAEPESERSGGGWPGQQDGAEFVCPDCEQAQDVGVREPGRDVGAACDERKTGYVRCWWTAWWLCGEHDVVE